MSDMATVELSGHINAWLSDFELTALAEWHADPARKTDLPYYLRYVDHIKRAAELIELTEGAS